MFIITRSGKSDELKHYGVLGMRWGHRKQKTSKYSKLDRIRNGRELNKAIEKSREKSSTGKPSAKEVYKTSSTMKKFISNTKNDYKKRNDIYDGKHDVPKGVKKQFKGMFDGEDLRYYGYGEYFKKLMRKKASELVYNKQDVDAIMELVFQADMNKMTDTYNPKASYYWH